MCNGLNSFYWVLPSSKVSYLDTNEEDSSSMKPLYHKKQAKRQETDLPQICQEWKVNVCTCAGRGSGLGIVTQTRGSIEPSYLRGSRTEGREQGSATTCRYDRLRRARRQQVSGRQNTSSWLAPPRAPGISWAKTPRPTLHWFLTHWSLPSQASVFRKFTYIRIFLVLVWSKIHWHM